MKKIIFAFLLLFIISCWNNEVTEKNPIQEATSSSSEEKIILALWDSLTAWYNLDIIDSFPSQLEGVLKVNDYNYKVQNAWVSWDTSKNLLDRIGLYDDIDVSVYLLWIWSNDWLRLQSVEDMRINILKIIEHLQEVNPNATIVLEWMQMPLNVWVEYSNDFKQVFIDIQKEKQTKLYEFLLEWVATKKELNLSDWIHPNKQWYSIMANNLYNFLEKENIITK